MSGNSRPTQQAGAAHQPSCSQGGCRESIHSTNPMAVLNNRIRISPRLNLAFALGAVSKVKMVKLLASR
jgi:hypothetical protein